MHTITTDNGKEFARALEAFFAQPYHSWERGLNEHTNGLVRQYFPKATDSWTLLNSSASRPYSTTGRVRRWVTELPRKFSTRAE